jgi:hypothetical protein
MITKKVYEEYFRYHDFGRINNNGCLSKDEVIDTASVIVCSALNENETYPEMISDVMPYRQTMVLYYLKGGEKGKEYKIIIRITTNKGQKFESNPPISLKIM